MSLGTVRQAARFAGIDPLRSPHGEHFDRFIARDARPAAGRDTIHARLRMRSSILRDLVSDSSVVRSSGVGEIGVAADEQRQRDACQFVGDGSGRHPHLTPLQQGIDPREGSPFRP
jgi:hypothetical protein